jgi:hypothetical protein
MDEKCMKFEEEIIGVIREMFTIWYSHPLPPWSSGIIRLAGILWFGL